MTASLDSESFALLVELREQLWGALPLRAHGYAIEMTDPDGLRAQSGLVWLELRFIAPGRDPVEGALALMPEPVLRRPEEARMRLSVWLETWRQLLDEEQEQEYLRGLAFAYLDARKAAKLKRVSEPDVLREALYRALGRWLPVPERRDVKGRTAVERAHQVLEEVFPVGEDASLQFIPHSDGFGSSREPVAGLGIRVILRLVIWERDGDSRSIRDVKEQEVLVLGARALFDVDRVEPYLRGWALALEQALADPPMDLTDTLMPCDLVFSDVLDLAKPRSAEDFRDAFLVRSRLGRLVRGS